LRFTVEEVCHELNLCGCKFTTNPPFCDKESCANLVKKHGGEEKKQETE
jgi:hypothetical protein